LGGAQTDAGDGVEQFNLMGERADHYLDLGGECRDKLDEERQPRQDRRDNHRVMGAESVGQRRAQDGNLVPQPA